jgi:hypothetical protein
MIGLNPPINAHSFRQVGCGCCSHVGSITAPGYGFRNFAPLSSPYDLAIPCPDFLDQRSLASQYVIEENIGRM